MKDKELLSVATGFRKGVIGHKESTRWCYALSAPLECYLHYIGIDCELTMGHIEAVEHYWITLPDRRILDPTADQFNEDMPKVYLGEKPANYRD